MMRSGEPTKDQGPFPAFRQTHEQIQAHKVAAETPGTCAARTLRSVSQCVARLLSKTPQRFPQKSLTPLKLRIKKPAVRHFP